MSQPFYSVRQPAPTNAHQASIQWGPPRPENTMANMNQPRTYNNQGYMQNGSVPQPGAAPLLPNQGRVIQTGPIRVLCIADVRGTCSINRLSLQNPS